MTIEQTAIAKGLKILVGKNTIDDSKYGDDPMGPYIDGTAIAIDAFNFGMSLAIEHLIAVSVDPIDTQGLLAIIAEMKRMKVTTI